MNISRSYVGQFNPVYIVSTDRVTVRTFGTFAVRRAAGKEGGRDEIVLQSASNKLRLPARNMIVLKDLWQVEEWLPQPYVKVEQ